MADLELTVSSGSNENYLVAARSGAGDTGETPSAFPFDAKELGRLLRDVELAIVRSATTTRRTPGQDEISAQKLGAGFFNFLFPGAIREHLSAVRNQAARDGEAIQVRLRVRSPELAALPWEFLYDPSRDDYLCLSMPLIRYLEVLEPPIPLAVAPPVRVLGMVAHPRSLATLGVEHEKRWLSEALAGLEKAGQVELAWTSGQTWRDLQDALDDGRWNIFHFIGHGSFDANREEGALALAGEEGGVNLLAASDLGVMLGEHHALRLVVLNCCEGARASTGEMFSSTAAVLTRRGIPAVVAMQHEISDRAAVVFARDLYKAIAGMFGIDQAVTRARRAIKFSRPDTLEWATPALYVRSTSTSLFDPTTASGSPEAATQPPALSRPVQPRAPAVPNSDRFATHPTSNAADARARDLHADINGDEELAGSEREADPMTDAEQAEEVGQDRDSAAAGVSDVPAASSPRKGEEPFADDGAPVARSHIPATRDPREMPNPGDRPVPLRIAGSTPFGKVPMSASTKVQDGPGTSSSSDEAIRPVRLLTTARPAVRTRRSSVTSRQAVRASMAAYPNRALQKSSGRSHSLFTDLLSFIKELRLSQLFTLIGCISWLAASVIAVITAVIMRLDADPKWWIGWWVGWWIPLSILSTMAAGSSVIFLAIVFEESAKGTARDR
jgi:hypothetical protein